MQVWELAKCKLRTNHFGHTGYINTVTVSPDGSLCASGGKDASAFLICVEKPVQMSREQSLCSGI